ncbi:MAG: glycine/betaine ABC transporter permease, partial [Rhodobacteraceae bacterium]|nr:glycine/betaine ABC transporter permease [Paracoccaceae bacterium]
MDRTDRARPALRPGVLIWVVALVIAALASVLAVKLPGLKTPPAALHLPLDRLIDVVLGAIVDVVKPAVRFLAWLLTQPMLALQAALNGLPWLSVATAFTLLAWAASGPGLAGFTVAGCLVTVVLGYWTEALNTLALVGISVPLAVATGFGLGLLAHRHPRARHAIDVTLDFMQTIPAFAYLIPILLLFGFGPVVGLIASAIYAAPPMVRNTLLGLQRVPEAQVESGLMSGCTDRQLFWQVRLPGAMPQILVGVNQTTMQSLSMVIIAAIIGGFDDIGWAILTALRKAQFGQSLLSGLVIVFLAV